MTKESGYRITIDGRRDGEGKKYIPLERYKYRLK